MTAPSDAGTLVDTNIIIDVITGDPRWGAWSTQALADAADAGEIAINPIVYTELAAGFRRIEDLDAALPTDVYRRDNLPWPAAFVASVRLPSESTANVEISRSRSTLWHDGHSGCSGFRTMASNWWPQLRQRYS